MTSAELRPKPEADRLQRPGLPHLQLCPLTHLGQTSHLRHPARGQLLPPPPGMGPAWLLAETVGSLGTQSCQRLGQKSLMFPWNPDSPVQQKPLGPHRTQLPTPSGFVTNPPSALWAPSSTGALRPPGWPQLGPYMHCSLCPEFPPQGLSPAPPALPWC